MKLIAVKDISSQLPAGAEFEQASATDANILIALGLARETPDHSIIDSESPGQSSGHAHVTASRRQRYRTRALKAED